MATLFDSASLVMIPSGVKEDKLYSIKPTDGSGDFTFSRGSDIQATRVNASGLIEKAKVNLLEYSNTFSNSYWTKNGSTITGGQTGYDGSSDAWLLESSIAGNARIEKSITEDVSTFSAYAKAGNVNWIWLSDGTANVYFDLQNGVKGTQTGGIDASIEDVGSGWYRVSLASASRTWVRIFPAQSDTGNSVVGSNILIQDAALCHGLIAQDYVETTTTAVVEGLTADLPRLDYSGGASCPSLLLEPSRTNRIVTSEYHGNKAVGGGGGFVITDNYGISPEGVQNACRIQYTSGNTYIVTNNISASIGDVFTISFWAKGTAGEKIVLYADGAANANVFKSITLTNDWVRYEGTTTAATANGNVTPHILVGYGETPAAADFQIYGWQAEIGSYATSYIPTYGTAANRGIDTLGNIQIPTFDNETNYSVFFEMTRNGVDNSEIADTWEFRRTDFVKVAKLWVDAPSAQVRWRDEAQSGATMAAIPFAAGQTKKMCMVYDGVTFKTYVDGALNNSYDIVTPIPLSKLYSTSKSFDLKQLLIFKTSLTSSEAIALTTI